MDEIKKCSYCAETINKEAVKCKHCGEILDLEIKNARLQQSVSANPQNSMPNTGIAAILSFFIPGLGQMYKGDVGAGILWLIFTLFGYFLLIIPGLIIHLVCIVNAASSKAK